MTLSNNKFPVLSSSRLPPYRLNEFLRMTDEEAREFMLRFEQWIPAGVDNLCRRITSTDGFESWKPEATETDLLQAGEWMLRTLSFTNYEHVVKNVRVRDEATNKVAFTLPEYVSTGLCITDEDSPVGVELGALFAHLLLQQNPDVRMRVETSASSWDEKQPVLFVDRRKSRKTNLCAPITLGINVTESLATKKSKADSIREVWGFRMKKLERDLGLS